MRPRREGGAAFGREELREGFFAEGDHFTDLDQREATEAKRRMIDEAVGFALVAFERVAQRRQGVMVNPEQQRIGFGRGADLVEKNIERRVGHGVEAERWLAHFADASAPGGGVFGAVMRVQAERHFQFVDGLGGEALDENFVEPPQGPVVAFESGNAVVDGEPGLHGFGKRGEAGERW